MLNENTTEIQRRNAIILANIRVLCAKNKTSITKIEKELGYGNGSVSGWKNAKKPAPMERIREIADYFHVFVGDIMEESFSSAKQIATPNVTDNYVSFPVIGDVAAGWDHIAYEDWTGDNMDIPRSWLHGRPASDYFVLRVKGDSMYPDYQDGDHVLILRQATMDRSGQVGVVRYNGESATLKRIEYVMGEDWMTLRPINPQFPPVTIRDAELEQCTVFGVAKMVIRELQQ